MTKQLEAKLPKFGGIAEVENPTVVAHFFNPCGAGDWYVLEGERQDNGDVIFYGYVKSMISPMFDEFGTFTLSELEGLELPFGLGIERDIHWSERTLNELLKELIR